MASGQSKLSNYLSWAKIVGWDLLVVAGVPTESSVPKGALAIDKTNGNLYQNTGTFASATWTQIPGFGSSIDSSEITDGTIANVDISTSAAIAFSKLASLATGHILAGNAGVVTDVTVSGDATISASGVVTVASATAAFNIGTNETFTKEVNHTVSVSDSTTTNTAGGNLSYAAGKGTGTAAGGTMTITSGASSNGTGVNPGASGNTTITVGTPGTATTGTAGAAGTIALTGVAGGNSTGASSTAGAGSDITATAGNGGASSGGGDTGGRGGNIIFTAGVGGTGATAGRDGMIFQRSRRAVKTTVTAMTTSATIATSAILGGIITANQGAAGAATYTMPTGTVLAAALPTAFTTGDSIEFTIVNISTNAAEDVTVAGDTGTTMKGNAVVNSNDAGTSWSVGTFRAVMTGANAFDVYRVA